MIYTHVLGNGVAGVRSPLDLAEPAASPLAAEAVVVMNPRTAPASGAGAGR
jgi:hypothetical protein